MINFYELNYTNRFIMKRIAMLSMLICLIVVAVQGQDRSKRESPFSEVSVKTDEGVNIAITYSRPSIKGRQLGVDIAKQGVVWRTGANEATTFEVDKDVNINGKSLKKGKYSIYSIPDASSTTVIFNKVWEQWGTNYDESQDALRVEVPTEEKSSFQEQFTITPEASGKVNFLWGNYGFAFQVK